MTTAISSGSRRIRGAASAGFAAAAISAAAGVGISGDFGMLVVVGLVSVTAITIGVAAPDAIAGVAFLPAVAVSFVSGTAALAVLGACLLLFGWLRREPLHPLVLVGATAAMYMVVGGVNISTYRGTLDNSTMVLIFWHILAMLIGIVLSGGIGRRWSAARGRQLRVKLEWRLAALAPGVLGVLLCFAAAGFAILHPYSRSLIGGLPLLLAESLFVGLLLWACHAFSVKGRILTRDKWVLASMVFLLAMPGYRGWPLIGVVLLALSGAYFGKVRIGVRAVVVVAVLGLVLIAGGEWIRRDTQGGRSVSTPQTTSQLAAKNNATHIPPGIRELHFSFRETVGLTQVMVQARNSGRRIHGSLLLGDFLTLLPGKQTSGLVSVGDIVGISGTLGLTAGAVGASYMDLGQWSLCLFLFVGLVVGWAWRMAPRDPRWAMTYFLVAIYTMQWIHRGTPKASYLVVPIFFFTVATVGMLRSNRPAARSAGARSS